MNMILCVPFVSFSLSSDLFLESGLWSVSGTWTLSAQKRCVDAKLSLPKGNWHESQRTDEAKATENRAMKFIGHAIKLSFILVFILQFVFPNFNLNLFSFAENYVIF